ncbi:MAG TPA: GNAT family N-acetyltransferase [Streptosporangiaceae bacterium]|jgi:GNAT superfamily N-acetyltransferase|nr:GNAT family N-acetyltransferase [Streptosporangiaceae bacterium]
MIDIGLLEPSDRGAWEELARGYKEFYQTPTSAEQYEAVWHQLMDGTEFRAFGARLEGTLVGITHYFFHPAVWYGEACYLQDLFVAEAARGQGAARALIERVAEAARDRGVSSLYWHTQEQNERARALYDKLASYKGFIRYQYPL